VVVAMVVVLVAVVVTVFVVVLILSISVAFVVVSILTSMRIIHVPSMLAPMTRRRSGDDLVVALVKRGYAPSRMTSNIGTWDCGRPGTELMTEISGVILWKWRHSSRGMLHDDMMIVVLP